MDELIVGDGGAFDGATQNIVAEPVDPVAAVEAIDPFPKVARQVLGTDPVMRADQPGLDIAEQGMDDREVRGGIGARALDHRRVLEMRAEVGILPAVAVEAVSQEV